VHGQSNRLKLYFHLHVHALYIANNYFLFFQIASDYGGPRKEFFRLILIEIKEKYFDKGIKTELFNLRTFT
jgi:hypothetical protein